MNSVKVAPRRWRGVALAATAVILLGAGIATANAATVGGNAGGNKPKAAAVKDPTRGAKGVAGLVNAANAFLDTLTDDQKASVLLDFTSDNATAWSNLPCGSSCRVGIQLSTLTDDQLTAAKAVLTAATGTGTGSGFDQISDILAADDNLAAQGSTGGGGAPPSSDASAPAADPSASAPAGTPPSGDPGAGGGGGGGYGSGLYLLAFLGTPSATGTWQLHFGGHHLAVNLTYKKGKVAGTTPFFIGVEPTSFIDDDGNTVQALAKQKDAISALVASLSTKQLTSAKLTESFSDVLLGPDKDGQFPATKEGVSVKALSPKQKKLVLDAIRPWVSIADDATAQQLLKTYESQLDKTFIGYSGTTALDTQGDYVRIDGPGVWIEFVCQNGVVYNNQIHFHTVYRDHTRDYGGEFSF
ncbi:hypothetical protein BJ973_000732 [Actinoplanes tereljensis]|uniref:DUF3500 domain-containing protein n=1 Tax=Paractinoplanes tereljensis TaxID=571912 RepID=A0A919TW40_9ACTN|nr:DUF3500 domain-containing protein [Actinoplanes tereljensis]GIF22910.1 hypothetical protein Ate02nite_56400 [Actinoplanes tereljensis]